MSENEDFVLLWQYNIEKIIDVPLRFEGTYKAKINWVSHIEGDYFEVAVKGIEYPFDGGCNIYLSYIKNGVIIPISSTMVVTEEEDKILSLYKKLHLDTKAAMDKIILNRIQNIKGKACG